MKDHHRDSLTTAFIGVVCGCVIGSGYMGYLQPLLAAVTSGEHAADWFSGTGTWIVGIAAAILTFQQHRSAVQRDRIAGERLEMERKINETRIAAEAIERAHHAAEEKAVQLNKYKVALARLGMPANWVRAAKDPRGMSYDKALSIVTKIRDTLPVEPLEHSRWITKGDYLSKIAGLDALTGICRSRCEDFVRHGGPVHARVMLRPYLESSESDQLSNIFEVTKKIGEIAADFGELLDQ